MTTKIHWSIEPEEKDYDGAESFLSLILSPREAAVIINRLRYAARTEYYVKDILRQSKLPLLDITDSQVSHVLDKIKSSVQISSILLLRGDVRKGLPLIVADGYHRVCAAYHLGDDTKVRCHIADIN
jgi:uncharacterized protein (DUF1015 family)